MPTRRTFEMTLAVIVLAQPALAVVRLWLHKHHVTKPGATGDAAVVGAYLLGG